MKNIDFLQVLKDNQKLVWPIIDQNIADSMVFPGFCCLNSKYKSLIDFHHQIVADYPRRMGKYLRPTLLLLTAQAIGANLNDSLTSAAAMQISEDWILNHDDIEDDSPTRRGQPTLHRIYGPQLALNAGDALHLVMWKTLFANFKNLGQTKSLRILEEFYTMLNRTVLGQEIELNWIRQQKFDLTEEDILLVLESKTGYYTIAGPMRLGAIIANASDEQLNDIYKFGVLLGRSFQIIDDLLDLTSNFAGLKTSKGNDIYESKKTIMVLHLLRVASPKDKALVKSILLKPAAQKTPSDINTIIKLMEKYGSLDYGRQMATKFARQSKKIFQQKLTFIKKQPFRDQIESGIDFIVNRDH
jgi:geranylgeranyl diphosphate synthase type II